CLGRPLPPWSAAVLLVGGPLLGGLIGFLWRCSWRAAAAAVDRYYRLKDRSVTALEFLAKPAPTGMQSLQIADAAEHLRQVDPQQVVPWGWPRSLPYACAAAAVALALLLWPLSTPQAEGGPPAPLPHIVAEAERIEESLQDLEEEAKK